MYGQSLQALQWTLLDSLIIESSLYNLAMAFEVQPNSDTTDSISWRNGSIYSGWDAISNKRCVIPYVRDAMVGRRYNCGSVQRREVNQQHTGDQCLGLSLDPCRRIYKPLNHVVLGLASQPQRGYRFLDLFFWSNMHFTSLPIFYHWSK